MAIWPEELVVREKRRLWRTGLVAGVLYLVPVAVVACLGGESRWVIPHFHIAIPIVLIGLLPLVYLLMPVVDGVLVLGSVRPTTPRAALFVRCVIVEGIAAFALCLFFQWGEGTWPAVYWVLGLPAAFGVLRRIPAYQAALERIVRGEG